MRKLLNVYFVLAVSCIGGYFSLVDATYVDDVLHFDQIRESNDPDSPWPCDLFNGGCEMWVGGDCAIASNGNFWDVSGTINNARYQIGAGAITPFNPNGTTFPQGSIWHVQSGVFSGVPAMDVDLSGVSISSTGYFYLSVPK